MLCIAALGITLAGCGGAKLSTANEQMARGEYFDASKTYRKIYNKLTKREERPQRGEVAFRLGQCSEKLNQYARAAAAYQNAARYGYADSTLRLSIARMQHAEGKYAAAIKAYEEHLRYHPYDNDARNRLAGARMAAEKRRHTLCGAATQTFQHAPCRLRPHVSQRTTRADVLHIHKRKIGGYT